MAEAFRANILTIDDDERIRQSFRDYLEDQHFRVLEAENGIVGLEIFQIEKVDCILLDLRMPEMDGLEVLDEIRKMSPDTPVIVVSGAGVLADVVKALHLGAWDYILKPMEDLSILGHSVTRALERAQFIRQNRLHQEHLEKEVLKRTRELELTNKALRASEERFRQLMELLPEAVFEMELNGRISLANHKALENFGYCQADFERGVNGFDLIVPADHERAKENAKNMLDGEDIGLQEYNVIRKDGTTFPILLRSSIIYHDGNPVGYRGVAVDITEKKRIEAQLRQVKKMEAIGTLAGGIAHDFNNILTPIFVHTEMAQANMPVDNEQRYHLDRVLKAAHRARDLVQQILTFSRQGEQIKEPVQLGPIVKETIKFLRSTLPSTIKIIKKIEGVSGFVVANPIQIHQVLMNLCSNAAHAMREKGGKLEISLSVVDVDIDSQNFELSPGSYIRLTVKDVGHGINSDQIDHIFDPFFTTKEREEGTGMGLAVVHGIVKDSGGTIHVESEVDKGTTFHIFFPKIEKINDCSHEVTAKVSGGTERILLVDDEETIVESVQTMLTSLGYQVVTNNKSDDALRLFQENTNCFDLVITDQTMPNMTGIELVREIKKVRPDIPVILCTGFSDQIKREQSEAMGIDGFVMKPISMQAIAQSIRRVLGP